jgi:hypothetical protein
MFVRTDVACPGNGGLCNDAIGNFSIGPMNFQSMADSEISSNLCRWQGQKVAKENSMTSRAFLLFEFKLATDSTMRLPFQSTSGRIVTGRSHSKGLATTAPFPGQPFRFSIEKADFLLILFRLDRVYHGSSETPLCVKTSCSSPAAPGC